MPRDREDRALEQACFGMYRELRRFQDALDWNGYESHPAFEALQKLGGAGDRLNVHACAGVEDLFRPTDADPAGELRAIDADRHAGHFREDEVSEKGRSLRPEASRLPGGLLTAAVELHRAIQEKRKRIGTLKRRHWKTRCYAECLSDAELAVQSLLEGEQGGPNSARADSVH